MSLLEILSCFDWISPTIAATEHIRRGPLSGHTFYIDLESGWTGAQCERILKERGVSIYGRCIANGDAFFTVSKKQAEWAEYLLLKAGAPLKYHLFSERNKKHLR